MPFGAAFKVCARRVFLFRFGWYLEDGGVGCAVTRNILTSQCGEKNKAFAYKKQGDKRI